MKKKAGGIDKKPLAAEISKRNSDPEYGIQALLDEHADLLKKYPKIASLGSILGDPEAPGYVKRFFVVTTLYNIVAKLSYREVNKFDSLSDRAVSCANNGNYYQAFDNIAAIVSLLPDSVSDVYPAVGLKTRMKNT